MDAARGEGIVRLVDDDGTDPALFRSFLSLYESEMDKKKRGYKPLLDQIQKEGGDRDSFLSRRGRTGLYLMRNGVVIGGIVCSKSSSGGGILHLLCRYG